MSGSVSDRIIEARRTTCDDGEPILSDTIKVQERPNGTFTGTIVEEAVRILSLEKSQEVRVDIYEDRYVISPVSTETRGDSE